jgi:phosphoglycerate dehydrogenase-like enzyme
VLVVACAPDRPRPAHLALVEERAEVRYVGAEDLAGALTDAQALLLWDFSPEALQHAWSQAGQLQWVHVAAAGVDAVVFDELRRSSVVLTNARGVFDRPIAEFVLASILAFAKDLHRGHDLQLARRWHPRETRSITGARALIIGTGAIGRETARLLRAVGMEVRGAGRTARSTDPDFGSVIESAALTDHIAWADHVVVLAPLTDTTRGLVDARVLSNVKPGVHLVNVARGPIVDEDALVAGLESGAIGGASLDVFAIEPLPEDHPLWSTPGVVVSPHMSGDVAGSDDALARQFAENARRWVDGEPLMNVVDKDLGFSPSLSDGAEAAPRS